MRNIHPCPHSLQTKGRDAGGDDKRLLGEGKQAVYILTKFLKPKVACHLFCL